MPRPHTSRHAPLSHPKKKPQPVTRDDHPPPEDEFGGGDFCSLEETPSTEDDKPLD